jgi:hypothetical protein
VLWRPCAWTDTRRVSLYHLAPLTVSPMRAGLRRLYRRRALPGHPQPAAAWHSRAATARLTTRVAGTHGGNDRGDDRGHGRLSPRR